nr:copia-type polyprotein [Tanacetum cinerariifolium]
NEAWDGKKPTVKHLKVWGSLSHVHVPKERRTKLDDRSMPYVLTGMSEESKGYRLVDPRTMKVIISNDVVFEEDKEWTWDLSEEKKDEQDEISWGNYVFDHAEELNDSDDEEPAWTEENEAGPSEEGPIEPGPSDLAPQRQTRERRLPKHLEDYVVGTDLDSETEEAHVIEEINQDPVYFEKAIKIDKWKKAVDAEIEAIEKNNTWHLIDLPKDAKCIRVKWVYKTKLNENGEVEKYKARLVAKGYGQEYGIDYMEVFAPVARMDTIRMMVAIAAQRGWKLFQMDVKSAFLYGKLEEDVYVQQPPGYVIAENENKVYKLSKALYGLKQAPRAWFKRIDEYFMSTGFEKSKAENTLFIKKGSNSKVIFVNIYVDDLIFTSNDDEMMEDFRCSMKREFEMTDLGKMRFFLGIEVTQTTAGIHISQRTYALKMLERFGMLECNSVKNPMVPGTKLKNDDGEKVDSTLFKQMVGSLIPMIEHYDAAKRVMRYIQGTLDFGIWYERGGKGELKVYADSDYVGDLNDRKSTTGYVVLWDGVAITWASRKQSIVALSSTEAEYVAAAACACQVIWVRDVLKEFSSDTSEATKIQCDNTSAIKLSKNPVFHGKCKHIGVRYHFLRDLVNNGTVELEFCGTKDQLADTLTKPLQRDVFIKIREQLGVRSLKGKQDIDQV